MFLLMVSILATFAAPLPYLVWRYSTNGKHGFFHQRILPHVDRLVFLCLGAVMLAYLVPGNFQILGWTSLALSAAFGLAPWLLTSQLPRLDGDSGEKLFMTVALTGIGAHALIDGAALFSFSGQDLSSLVTPMIVLDRLTLGFLTWSLLYPRVGTVGGMVGIAAIAVLTLVGHQFVEGILQTFHGPNGIAMVNSALVGLVLYMTIKHVLFTKGLCADHHYAHMKHKDHAHSEHGHGHGHGHSHV